MSHNLEDMLTLVDGCATIVDEAKAADLKVSAFVSNGFKEVLNRRDFRDASPGVIWWRDKEFLWCWSALHQWLH